VLLGVGRLVPDKGFDVLVQAFSRLRESFPALRLRLAGDGPERPRLERIARETGVADAVDFLGWVPFGAVPAVMAEATMLVVPSRIEPLGMVAVQAAQMARPVVATRVGGLPEAVVDGETGLLVPPEDETALAAAIARLLRDPSLARRLGEQARPSVQARLAWDQHVAAYDNLYRRIAPRAATDSPMANGG
jgi:glycogen(starch) synthase